MSIKSSIWSSGLRPLLAGLSTTALVAACGGGGNGNGTVVAPSAPVDTGIPAATPPNQALDCDNRIASAFSDDTSTKVLLVKKFTKGDPFTLGGTADATTAIAKADLCLVKLLVGPRNAGPANIPSTSAGIGIEVMLPAPSDWNERIRVMGNGGWSGTQETNLTALSISGDYGSGMNAAAAWKGYVVSTSDNGHVGLFDGSFAMNADGTINQVLWKDFSERSLHILAEKTKKLTKVYYGKAHKYAYFDGFSTGGRQGLKLAQVYPSDFDGILDGAPAINWTSYHVANLYAPLAMLRDLGGPIALPKLSATTKAAVAACGGAQLGFLTDPLSCRYDPFADAAVLCTGEQGRAGVLGRSVAPTCLSAAEAQVFIKAWYGQTSDGSAPDPAMDSGSNVVLQGNNRLWFGWTRGTNLATSMGPVPISLSTDQTAISLQDPTYGSPAFKNATGNGTDKWKTLGYSELANVSYRSLLLQPEFSYINTDSPDLSGLKQSGAKVLMYHGLADDYIPVQGSINYYERAATVMGGIAQMQNYFKLYLIPGHSHSPIFATGANIPLPQSALGSDDLFLKLRDWVENKTEPDRINAISADKSVSMPLCPYPQKIKYIGTGSITASASYTCQ